MVLVPSLDVAALPVRSPFAVEPLCDAGDADIKSTTMNSGAFGYNVSGAIMLRSFRVVGAAYGGRLFCCMAIQDEAQRCQPGRHPRSGEVPGSR